MPPPRTQLPRLSPIRRDERADELEEGIDSETADNMLDEAETETIPYGVGAMRHGDGRRTLLYVALGWMALLTVGMLWHVYHDDIGSTVASASPSGRPLSVSASAACPPPAPVLSAAQLLANATSLLQSNGFAVTPVEEHPPSLADGCHTVYVDLGTNIGHQLRKIYHPELFPDFMAKKEYERWFGDPAWAGDRRHVCSFGFEANTAHHDYLKKVEKAYREHGFRMTMYASTAIGIKPSPPLRFESPNTAKNLQNTEWNARMLMPGEQPSAGARVWEVPVVSLPHWMWENVMRRKLPEEGTYDKRLGPPKIVVKIDVEGMEFELMFALLTNGILCKCHALYADAAGYSPEEIAAGTEGWKWIRKAVDTAMDCGKLELLNIDDETYHNDRPPLFGVANR